MPPKLDLAQLTALLATSPVVVSWQIVVADEAIRRKDKRLQTYFLRRSEAEDRNVPGLRLVTMHRVKGLEFNRVIIAGVNEGLVPYQGTGNESNDPTV